MFRAYLLIRCLLHTDCAVAVTPEDTDIRCVVRVVMLRCVWVVGCL